MSSPLVSVLVSPKLNSNKSTAYVMVAVAFSGTSQHLLNKIVIPLLLAEKYPVFSGG
jgi:hypothetical protein